jgi:hypothetical protein
MEDIEYQDEAGDWHEEVPHGNDRPETDVTGQAIRHPSKGGILSNGLAFRVAAHNGLSLLNQTKPQCAIFATVFALGLPSSKQQEGQCICDDSLSSPIAWLSRTPPERP